MTWHRDSIFDFSVAEIYNSVYHTNIKNEEFSDKDVFEKDLLRDVCETKDDYALIEELLEIQKSKILLVNNYGIHTDLENHIERNNRKRKTAC